MGVIYVLTLPDGLQYVGQAVHLKRRMREHSKLKNTGRKLKEWVIKYGWDQVKQEIVVTVPDDELNNEETRVIKDMGTIWPSGLNMTTGGEGGSGWGLDPERDATLRKKWSKEVKQESIAKGEARLRKLGQLPDIEFHAEMARLRRRAEKRGMPRDKLERLYPNTFTLEQIRKLQGKKHGVPGPKASGRLTAGEIKSKKKARKQAWDAKQRTS